MHFGRHESDDHEQRSPSEDLECRQNHRGGDDGPLVRPGFGRRGRSETGNAPAVEGTSKLRMRAIRNIWLLELLSFRAT